MTIYLSGFLAAGWPDRKLLDPALRIARRTRSWPKGWASWNSTRGQSSEPVSREDAISSELSMRFCDGRLLSQDPLSLMLPGVPGTQPCSHCLFCHHCRERGLRVLSFYPSSPWVHLCAHLPGWQSPGHMPFSPAYPGKLGKQVSRFFSPVGVGSLTSPNGTREMVSSPNTEQSSGSGEPNEGNVFCTCLVMSPLNDVSKYWANPYPNHGAETDCEPIGSCGWHKSRLSYLPVSQVSRIT